MSTRRAASTTAMHLSDTTTRVVSYNLLSSHLAAPSWFVACKPENLDQAARLRKIKEKLRTEMSQNSIICLQEISTMWAGHLHTFFANNDYYLVTGLYGNRNNGYMGVGMAIPTKKYELRAVDITRVADTKRMPRKVEEPPSFLKSLVSNVVKRIKDLIINTAIYFKLYKPPIDLWDNALYRSNQMICSRLFDRSSSKEFVVGTYHMPCMFQLTAVMVAHCALSAQHIHRYASGLPYFFVGDFNIKPNSLEYQLLTKGNISPSEENYPAAPAGDDWTPALPQPLKSAYLTKLGAEPDFTNYAKVREDPVFVDTLDYLFYSEGIEVQDVLPLPSRETVPGPLPNDNEPSDHILLAADFRVL